MAATKNQLEGRSSTCVRKYRIFVIFVGTILCVQVYLAYSFLRLENQTGESSPGSSREIEPGKSERNEGLPEGSYQLKLPPDKPLNSPKTSSQIHSNRTIVKLDRQSLNFTPICDVTGREAVSAVSRAHTQLCKETIVNITCMSQMGMLYPEQLHSSCPHSTGFRDIPRNLGCFKDDKTQRILSGYYSILKGVNSPQHCAFLCLQSGYPYAGTEYSIECFCGVEEPPQTKRLPDSSCNMKCPGDLKQSCGGYLTINVFKTGIKKFKAQEARNSSVKTGQETPIRIAFLLTVNGRASRQVKRLINILYDPSHFYYIHVDARQDYMYREMLEVEKKCSKKNIKVAKGSGLRHASIWGGASLLTTLLTSARQMLQHSKDWDFLVNLSESDFPVKSNAQLVDFLTLNKGLNFVKSHGREVQRFITKQGLDKTFVECEARMWRLGDRQLPKGIQIDGGSDWMALSRDFVEFVTDPQPDPLVSGLLQVFRFTLLPAESFFHTTLRNSIFCDTYVDNNLHVTNWKRKLGCKCQYKAVVDWCGCSPNDFKLEDLNKLRNTAEKNLFFARKFEPVVDQRIIDKIEEWLYPERYNNSIMKGYDRYWQSIYHHADQTPLVDDTALTISISLSRIIYSKYDTISSHIRLLETTGYFESNKFKAILVHAEVDIKGFESSTYQNDFPERVEGFIVPRHQFTTSKTWSRRIRHLEVNTDYDQKEQMFRNFLGGIGPLSSPILSYEFEGSLVTPRNLTVLWIDPRGNCVDVNHLQVEEMSLIGSLKPQLEEPLVIGEWQVVLMTDSLVASHLRFLVTPFAFWKNRRITPRKARELHNGPRERHREYPEIDSKWLSILKDANVKIIGDKDHRNFTENRVGVELNAWIDELVEQFYRVDRICLGDDSRINRTTKSPRKCSLCDWSSMSPDPKADTQYLGGI
ncbi:xylosyltransferase oxt [Fopius arisanus]|uniref:protein xylosyltransferase n=2 Tax=Fopius arisanus TaxID=64838 RepID=A0A9R1TYT1_9HYME|nr:PREDICTED: xylosyltransferase oxt [Fopius arisanus]